MVFCLITLSIRVWILFPLNFCQSGAAEVHEGVILGQYLAVLITGLKMTTCTLAGCCFRQAKWNSDLTVEEWNSLEKR